MAHDIARIVPQPVLERAAHDITRPAPRPVHGSRAGWILSAVVASAAAWAAGWVAGVGWAWREATPHWTRTHRRR